MGATFAGLDIVSDSFGAFNGGFVFTEGDLEDEIYEFSIPRASGVGEKWSGDRRRIHVLRCQWYSTNESSVRARILAWRENKTVGTLALESASSGTLQYQYCRLVQVQWGQRASGYRPNGGVVSILDATLYFKQVRVV